MRRRDNANVACIILGLYPSSVRTTTEGVGFKWANEGDIGIRLDLVFHSHRPKATVDEHHSVAIIENVLRSSIERCEDPCTLSRCGAVRASPLGWHRWFALVWRSIRCHAVQRLSHGKDFAINRLSDIATRLYPNVAHAAQNGMALLLIDDRNTRALCMVLAVMSHPGLA